MSASPYGEVAVLTIRVKMVSFHKAQECGIDFLMPVDQPKQIPGMPLCEKLAMPTFNRPIQPRTRMAFDRTYSKDISERRLNQIPQLVRCKRLEYRRDIV
jgi:hypothetical protein